MLRSVIIQVFLKFKLYGFAWNYLFNLFYFQRIINLIKRHAYIILRVGKWAIKTCWVSGIGPSSTAAYFWQFIPLTFFITIIKNIPLISLTFFLTISKLMKCLGVYIFIYLRHCPNIYLLRELFLNNSVWSNLNLS